MFFAGFFAGIVALALNFLLRLEGIVPFPPEQALAGFISVVPESVEEPMVQQFGGLAGQLGLLVASVIAAAVYGALLVLFVKYAYPRLRLTRLSTFEILLVFSLVPWVLFGLVLFPLLGQSAFGTSGSLQSSFGTWTYPVALLLVQAFFALALLPGFRGLTSAIAARGAGGRPVLKSRREFVEKSVIGVLVAAAAIVGLTTLLGGLSSAGESQVEPTGGSQPIDLQDAPAIFSDPRLAPLVDSEVTPDSSFYQVDIDIIDPSVDASSWSMPVDGLVRTPKTYGLDDVMSLPPSTQYTTLECVSNVINGNLISNAKWMGVKMSDLLADVGGVESGASYVVFYSVDGYSVGIPLSKAMEPECMLAYMMNDQPLPAAHGYPLRALVPGLYGMMSAKWINHMSLMDSTYQGYWQTRGWTNNATINTVSFIVLPQSGSQVSLSQNGGSIMIAGYAFAGDRGVSAVEISFDNGTTWLPAKLKKPISNLTWALWAYEWVPQSQGQAFILVRATDGSGQTQTAEISDTFPNGATGYAYISVNVAK